MSGASEFLALEPSVRFTELEKKLCSTLTNVVRGTSEFLPFYHCSMHLAAHQLSLRFFSKTGITWAISAGTTTKVCK